MKNYSWEYNVQINQSFQNESKNIYSQRKIDVESVFGIMKPILSFTRKSVRGINKNKRRELGLVLMILNIRKVPAQRELKIIKS